MDHTKVPIEMKPFNAITVLAFCREFVNKDGPKDYKFQALREAIDELELQLTMALTDEQWEEIHAENAINTLIGKAPI